MLIIGIDEVARGCLAGPVVSCAVVLRPEIVTDWATTITTRPKLTDSKQMTPVQRKIAKDWILGVATETTIGKPGYSQNSPPRIDSVMDLELSGTGTIARMTSSTKPSLAWGLGKASVQEIDEMNIREATFLAMNRALEACLGMLSTDHPGYNTQPIQVWVDGNAFKFMADIAPSAVNWPGGISFHTQVKGDLLVPSIACASIIAKEIRDAELDMLVASNPEELGCYGWATNRAYGTSDHFRAILQNGLTVWHRLSFLDRLLTPGRTPNIKKL